MKNLIPKLYKKLENSNVYIRKSILITADQLILYFAMYLSLIIDNQNVGNPVLILKEFYSFFLLALLIYLISGQYRALTRYYYTFNIYKIAARNLLLIFFIWIFRNIISDYVVNLNALILFSFLATGFSSLLRSFLGSAIINIRNKTKKLNNVIIYGAGAAGAQLATTIRLEKNYNVLFFVDDNKNLWGRSLYSIPIKSPNFLKNNYAKAEKILLAIPSLNGLRRKEILNQLSKTTIPTFQIPSIKDLISGKEKITSLKPITVEELLGREPVLPINNIISEGIENKNICVTGAGGSIGSELCIQMLKHNPSKIVLLDNSESNLYQLGIKIKKIKKKNTVLIMKLGDATDLQTVNAVFKENNINIVFHAAAYKHVPIVEENPIQGISNNVISTLVICEACLINDLNQMILISTDKAVRPTNVMGASKRLAEQIVLEFASKSFNSVYFKDSNKTLFSLVRFGNVLGSSGSVVPLFEKQINEGGPVTITHKKIIRYFMTIEEAAQLVLHVAGLAKGGEVFLLDMGKPVSIQYLAEQMIRLSGFSVKSKENTLGDIEIKYTGLRPGEKLFEELLLDTNSEKTIHPLIYKGVNEKTKFKNFYKKIAILKVKIDSFQEKEVLKIVSELVPEWKYDKKFNKIINSEN